MIRLLPLVLIMALASGSVGANTQLPDLGDPTGTILTPEQEYRLGRAWLRSLRSQAPILQDPLVQDYVEHLVYRLASHSDLAEPDLAIVVVNNREINAFAVPGGVIGLNAGLFLNAETEDEVAAVVAHEIAHVSQRHFTRRYADSRRMNQAMLAAMLASLAVAIAGDAQAGMAGIATSQAAAIQSQLAYSRHHEREADRVGMQTLVNAGMDPHAMPRFFERMARSRQYAGSPPEFVLTHPVTETRIADSRNRAESLARPRLRATPEFDLIRARIQAAFISDAQQALTHFRGQYEGGSSIAQQAAGFGLVMSALRARQYDLAESTLHRLMEHDPDQFWYRLALAEVAENRDDHARAIEILEQVLDLMPGNYATSVMLARNLIATEDYAEARRLLDRLLLKRQDPMLWSMMADAWGREGDRARAHQARGEYLFAIGQEQRGLEQMRFALNQSNERFALHSQVRARLQEMERLANERF
ncbi:M48 family metalloprotease [Isoalcanivorax indicus]|uniref:M48 family metalloprotease n=1 Tax=Isoalcanivorax indicus TaxID=2202653 RepID=UPI001FE7820E|nr:M48 family metalloprotease [Isoalcanivorax indicus]